MESLDERFETIEIINGRTRSLMLPVELRPQVVDSLVNVAPFIEASEGSPDLCEDPEAGSRSSVLPRRNRPVSAARLKGYVRTAQK